MTNRIIVQWMTNEKLNEYIGINYYNCTDVQLIENVEINDRTIVRKIV